MLYFSEILNKTFKTEQECIEAEEAAKAAEARKNLEKEEKYNALNIAFEELLAADKKYRTLLADYTKKYGAFVRDGRAVGDFLFNHFLHL